LLLLTACAPEPAPFPPGVTPPAAAAVIPEGRTLAERRELFQAAISFFDRGDGASAAPFFERIAATSPELGDYGLRYLARILDGRGDPASATPRWQALLDRFPDSVWRGEAELALARARAAESNWHAADNLVTAAREDLEDSAERAAVLGLAAEAARRLGQIDRAESIGAELRRRHPRSPEAVAERELASESREGRALSSAGRAREEVSLLLAEGEAARALELVRAAEDRFPSDLPELLWLESSALAHGGDNDGSTRLLERIRATYPRHPVGAQALHRLGSQAWNRDEDETALGLLDLYVRQFPNGAQAPEAIYAIARIHQEAGRYAEAARGYARLAKLYPKTSLASEARFRVGWSEYRAGKAARAVKVFGDIAETDSPDRTAALYWKARASGDLGNYQAVLEQAPESYYAALGEERLRQAQGAALAGRLPLDPSSAAGDAACTSGDPHYVRFAELKAMSFARLARRELAEYQERVSGCDAFFIRSWIEIGGYRQSVGRATRSGGCGLASPWLRNCYPLAFWDVVARETSAHSLDPFLVAALIRQESLFDPEARSSANALGLMQILPPTGERLAATRGENGFHTDLLLEPARNVALGTTYLRNLLDRYDGNVPRALAAYNAGEAAVDKWQRRYLGLEDDEFVESISYRETRNYVKCVLGTRRLYEALYAGSSARSGG